MCGRMEGGTTFYIVTDGIESALEKARKAAGGQDVSLAGGAQACGQYLKAGLVAEMEINLVPILLGSGERLFAGVGPDLGGLELKRTIVAPGVVHLKFGKG
jgi:dihydrofolate reductase